MTRERQTSPTIADSQGPTALPRKSGELVFNDDWERRVFAIAVGLAEQGLYDWSEFQRYLIMSVADAERDDPQNPSRGYYESWLVALEALIEEKRLLPAAAAR